MNGRVKWGGAVILVGVVIGLSVAIATDKKPNHSTKVSVTEVSSVPVAAQDDAARPAAEAKAEQERQDAAKWGEYKAKATALIRQKIPTGKPYGDYEVDWQDSSPHSIRLLLIFKEKAPKPSDARNAALYGLKLALQVLTEMGMTENLGFAVARVHAPGGKGATGKTLVSTYGGKAMWNSRSDSINWESE